MHWRAVVVVLVVSGCAPTTQADGCFGLTTAICEKDKSCGAIESVERCRVQLTAICCGEASCDRLIDAQKGQKFLQCESAYRALTCAQVLAGLSPQTCN